MENGTISTPINKCLAKSVLNFSEETLGRLTHSIECPHTQEYMARSNWTQCFDFFFFGWFSGCFFGLVWWVLVCLLFGWFGFGYLYFLREVSLCSPGCLGTHSVNQAGFKFRVPLPLECWDYRDMPRPPRGLVLFCFIENTKLCGRDCHIDLRRAG